MNYERCFKGSLKTILTNQSTDMWTTTTLIGLFMHCKQQIKKSKKICLRPLISFYSYFVNFILWHKNNLTYFIRLSGFNFTKEPKTENWKLKTKNWNENWKLKNVLDFIFVCGTGHSLVVFIKGRSCDIVYQGVRGK